MRPFAYTATSDVDEAVRLGSESGSSFVAGATDVLNLIRDGVEDHDRLVDINALPARDITTAPGRIRLGALARMSDVAADPQVRTRIPLVSEALEASSSPQVRNMASLGGNLMQRTRCWYFRDGTSPCNKRDPGSGCSALEGQNRWNAVLGGSTACVAVQPSDLAVALTTLGATIETTGPDGPRRIPVEDFYLLPGSTPEVETPLTAGELITAIEVPTPARTVRSTYLKVRDRASFEFAIVSVAAAVDLRGGVVRGARLAFGGVAPRPWRVPTAERALLGTRLDPEATREAARLALAGARPLEHNGFKIDLLQRTISEALRSLAARTSATTTSATTTAPTDGERR